MTATEHVQNGGALVGACFGACLGACFGALFGALFGAYLGARRTSDVSPKNSE